MELIAPKSEKKLFELQDNEVLTERMLVEPASSAYVAVIRKGPYSGPFKVKSSWGESQWFKHMDIGEPCMTANGQHYASLAYDDSGGFVLSDLGQWGPFVEIHRLYFDETQNSVIFCAITEESIVLFKNGSPIDQLSLSKYDRYDGSLPFQFPKVGSFSMYSHEKSLNVSRPICRADEVSSINETLAGLAYVECAAGDLPWRIRIGKSFTKNFKEILRPRLLANQKSLVWAAQNENGWQVYLDQKVMLSPSRIEICSGNSFCLTRSGNQGVFRYFSGAWKALVGESSTKGAQWISDPYWSGENDVAFAEREGMEIFWREYGGLQPL